jgi:hypothetical protein
MVSRAGFETATTPEVSFSSYEDFLNDLEDFKLSAKSKLNFSQGTVYHCTSKLHAEQKNRYRQGYSAQSKVECAEVPLYSVIS